MGVIFEGGWSYAEGVRHKSLDKWEKSVTQRFGIPSNSLLVFSMNEIMIEQKYTNYAAIEQEAI